ncbi:flavin-containing monooxygenase [Streptomyces sp. NPDC058457]|uniref:flavin-containing monooxygenase n=1 Tax=Streptomyces sp. NPDC058457 TaxID=3346507 RepID=UPI0036633363
MAKHIRSTATTAVARTALPSVGVIGAGISGLTAAKALQDYGVACTVFEAGDRIGGNWAFKNTNGRSSAYRSLHIDTSRTALSFRDFPMDDRYPDFPHHTEIYDYLLDYADAFGLQEQIRFDCEVTAARRLPGGGWELHAGGGTHRFDLLVVGNGHHWDPRLPSFPGRFDGPVIHSHHYIDPTEPLDLRDKRVLVVGIGNSAVDITSELARKGVASKAFISTRSGAFVIPKYILGRPVDRLVKTSPHIPLRIQRGLAALLPRLASGRMEDFGLPTPNHRFHQAHPTLSSELLLRLGSGDAVAKPDVAELAGNHVRFTDGTVEEIDAIIYATGYNISFPFFEADLISAPDNRLPLYKRMFKPGIDDLVFLGLAQPLPSLFPFIELQTKLLARYAAGFYALPGPGDMQRAIADEQRFNAEFAKSPRHTMEVDGYVYEHDMLTREFPAGLRRAQVAPPALAGRAMAEVVAA